MSNIITNLNSNNIKCQVIHPHLLDHAGIFATFYEWSMSNFKVDNSKLTKRTSWLSPHSIRNLKNKLFYFDLHCLYLISDIENAFDYFISILSNLFEECFTNILRTSKTKTGLLNGLLLKTMRKNILVLCGRYKWNRGAELEIVYTKTKNLYCKEKNLYE